MVPARPNPPHVAKTEHRQTRNRPLMPVTCAIATTSGYGAKTKHHVAVRQRYRDDRITIRRNMVSVAGFSCDISPVWLRHHLRAPPELPAGCPRRGAFWERALNRFGCVPIPIPAPTPDCRKLYPSRSRNWHQAGAVFMPGAGEHPCRILQVCNKRKVCPRKDFRVPKKPPPRAVSALNLPGGHAETRMGDDR